MSVKSLQAAILTAAQEQVREIEHEQAQEMETLKDKLAKQSAALEEQLMVKAEMAGNREARALAQAASLEAKADILAAKQEELQKTQQLVVDRVRRWDEATAKEWLEALLAATDSTGTVVPGELHRTLLGPLVKAKGLTMADHELPEEGGFILQHAHSEIDMRLSRLVEQVFTRHRAKLAQQLFGN